MTIETTKITLNCENYQATITDLGAELISLRYCDHEIMWDRNPEHWTGCSPVLFPIVGSLRNNSAPSAQGAITLPRHGLARKRKHTLLEHNDTRAVFELSSNEETLAIYPYEFSLQTIYELSPDGLTMTYKVSNPGACELPYCIGAHPAFKLPFMDDVTHPDLEDYCLEFPQETEFVIPELLESGLLRRDRDRCIAETSTILPLSHALFEKYLTVILRDLPEQRVILRAKDLSVNSIDTSVAQYQLSLSWSALPYLGLWTPHSDSPFIAIEPWCGCTDYLEDPREFEKKDLIQILSPKDSQEHRLHFAVQKIED